MIQVFMKVANLLGFALRMNVNILQNQIELSKILQGHSGSEDLARLKALDARAQGWIEEIYERGASRH